MSATVFEGLSEHQQVQALGALVVILAQGAPEPMLELVDSLMALAQDAAIYDPTVFGSGDAEYARAIEALADHLAVAWCEENGRPIPGRTR